MKDSDRQFEEDVWVEMIRGKTRTEIKKICADYVLETMNQKELNVFKGIISGDGDIGSRMASSHPEAQPYIDLERMKRLDFMAAQFDKYKVTYKAIDK